MSRATTVAVVQAAPCYLDLDESMRRAESLVRQAADRGAQLVAFGETWLAGYPAWLDHCPGVALWDDHATKQVFARLRKSSILVPGVETERLGALASDLGIVIVIGANERVETGAGNGTLYNALLVFDPDAGACVIHHRKLVPTHGERLVWGPGDGAGLVTRATRAGRVGGLVCWEHWMPLARQALHVAGEEIHVAMWPAVGEAHQIASRHYAFEGRCFVLAAGLLMRASDLPCELPRPDVADDALLLRGGSAIIAPNGNYVVKPVFDREEILIAEIDLDEIDGERMTLDVSGHYARPDVFDFGVRPSPRRE